MDGKISLVKLVNIIGAWNNLSFCVLAVEEIALRFLGSGEKREGG